MWQKLYQGIVTGETFLGNFLLLFVRLYWGSLLAVTGYGKLMHIHGIESTFAGLHIPYPLASAILVGILELLGGICLVLGFLSRIITIPLIIIFVVAYATAHVDSVHQFFRNPSLFVADAPFLFLLATCMVCFFGPGIFSLDHLWERKKK